MDAPTNSKITELYKTSHYAAAGQEIHAGGDVTLTDQIYIAAKEGREHVFEFIVDNYDELAKPDPGSSNMPVLLQQAIVVSIMSQKGEKQIAISPDEVDAELSALKRELEAKLAELTEAVREAPEKVKEEITEKRRQHGACQQFCVNTISKMWLQSILK